MKTNKLLCLLLALLGCLHLATAQPTAPADEQTKKVKKKYTDHTADYFVLANNPDVRHGQYNMEGAYWRGEGQYHMGERTGVWSFFGRGGLESQYDFTNLKQTYLRRPSDSLTTVTKVFVNGGYEKREVDSQAILLGGEARLGFFLGQNIRYPANAQRAGIQGTVVLAVEVSETGQVLGAKVAKSVNSDLDNESVRVFRLAPEDWIPTMVDGKPVRSIIYCPVSFRIM